MITNLSPRALSLGKPWLCCGRLLSPQLTVALLWLLAAIPAAPAAGDAPRPNILVLMAEDLSARVGAFGDPIARTPHLDALAATGVRFPNTFTTAGVCAPSRTSFITGLHQISVGGQHMRTSTAPLGGYLAVPPPEVKAFPEHLRAAGYFTFTDRKLDYQFSGIGAGTGPFTIWDAEDGAAALERLPQDKPFFALLNFFITHESRTFLPESVNSEPAAAVARAAQQARAELPQPVLPGSVSVPPYYPDQQPVRDTIADVYNNVQVMDSQVGAILRELEARELLDQTIVIWTTDHGDALPRAKRELHDSGLRVPMIIRWPEPWRPAGLAVGQLDERLISFVDLSAAILNLAGVPVPDHIQGRDPFDPQTAPRQYIYAARDRMDEQRDRVRAVRDKRYKYLYYYHPGTPGAVHLAYRDQGRVMQALWAGLAAGTLNADQRRWFEPRPEEALYDLRTDPHELNNLAGDPAHAAILTRMRSALGTWRLRVADLSDMEEADLASRFWPEGIQPVTAAPELRQISPGGLEIRAAAGASIGYRFGGGAWQLYTRPLDVTELVEGAMLQAKAVRYGHAESEVVTDASFTTTLRGDN